MKSEFLLLGHRFSACIASDVFDTNGKRHYCRVFAQTSSLSSSIKKGYRFCLFVLFALKVYFAITTKNRTSVFFVSVVVEKLTHLLRLTQELTLLNVVTC